MPLTFFRALALLEDDAGFLGSAACLADATFERAGRKGRSRSLEHL